MVEAEQRQNCRVQIVDVHFIFNGRIPELIGCAVGHAAAHAAAGKHGGEGFGIMVASRIVAAVAVPRRLAPEFTAPDNQRFVEQSALFQIFDESRQRLVNFLRAFGQFLLQILMMIPTTGPHLHDPHSPFNESPRDEQLFPLRAIPIQFADAGRFLAQIKRIRRLGLHPERHFVSLQPRFELRLLL